MKLDRTLLVLAAGLALFAACEDDNETPVDATSPVRVTDLAITDVTATTITLEWTAPGDNGGDGTATSYTLKRSASTINAANFSAATTVAGVPAPSPGGSAESFTVTGLDSTLTYYFALRATDEAGNTSSVSNNASWIPPGEPQHFVKVIPAFKDNTMFEEGAFSNGKGQYIFAGENVGGELPPPDARRALLAFAISDSLPAGAVVDSVRLALNMSRSLAGTRTVSVHRLSADWGEGISDASFEEGTGDIAQPNDATWLFRFYDTVAWATAGGDFAAGASAQLAVGTLGSYVWSSAQMTADVQSWLDTPAANFGWILIGDEATAGSAKRFDSRENPTAANRPKLTVYYTVP